MLVLLVLFIIIFLYFVAIPFVKNKISSETFGSRTLIAILTIFFITFAIIRVPRLNSEEIITVEVNVNDRYCDYFSVYQDKTSGTYFYVKQSLFNPLKMAYRVPVDSEKVAKCLEIQNRYNETLKEYEEIRHQFNNEINALNLFEP